MNEERVSRRQFFNDAGMLATGLITGAGIAGITSCAPEVIVKEVPKEVVREVVKEIPSWPWTYVKLDAELVRKKGHQKCYEGGCSYGAFAAIVDSLREKAGFPFTQIPPEMMFYGRGGVAGMGSLCGALNGAAAAITLVTGKDSYGRLVKELSEWYMKSIFPSDLSNRYATDHSFLVSVYKSDKILVTSVANSMLCSDSMANWCKVSGFSISSPERAERCARMTGDVVAQAVILLNNL